MTLEQLAAGQHAEQRIAFDGIPIAIPQQTAMICGSDDACCNRVDGSYALSLKGHLTVELMGPFSCEGDECNWECEPFGNKPTKPVRFVGTVQLDPALAGRPDARAYATVEKYCK